VLDMVHSSALSLGVCMVKPVIDLFQARFGIGIGEVRHWN